MQFFKGVIILGLIFPVCGCEFLDGLNRKFPSRAQVEAADDAKREETALLNEKPIMVRYSTILLEDGTRCISPHGGLSGGGGFSCDWQGRKYPTLPEQKTVEEFDCN